MFLARSVARSTTPVRLATVSRRPAVRVLYLCPSFFNAQASVSVRGYASVAVPRIGEAAPDFTAKALVNGEYVMLTYPTNSVRFKEVKLSDYKGKYLVLFFYPLDFTFVCPTEIIAFSGMSR